MSDPLKRFSNRSDNYARFRPGYPAGVIETLKTNCGLSKTSIIADVGSGTGILTKLFLQNGNSVFAIEPNEAMRLTAESLLRNYEKFSSLNATAEATTLGTESIDLVTAAQAFHWFDRTRAKAEFARILKPQGWVVLIWNERLLDSTPFLRAYEDLLLRYGTDYEKVRHENVTGEIAEFFSPESFELKVFQNAQHFDFEALMGRLLSSSYAPDRAHQNFDSMLRQLESIFKANQEEGLVTFEYETKVYYGHLSH